MGTRLYALALAAGTLALSPSTACSESFRIEYVPLDNSSKPILEIHARTAHTFVLLGRQLSDGSIKYYQGAGFYPEETGKLGSFKAAFRSPGHVDFTSNDETSDLSFRVKLAGSQENTVKFLIKSWNDKEYKLLSQNCISLVKAVGKSIGLDVGDPKSLDGLPEDVVRVIKNENDEDRALRFAIREHELATQQRGRDAATIRDAYQTIARNAKERQDRIDSINRLNNGMSPSGLLPANPIGGNNGLGGAGTPPCAGDLCFTYPWAPPTR